MSASTVVRGKPHHQDTTRIFIGDIDSAGVRILGDAVGPLESRERIDNPAGPRIDPDILRIFGRTVIESSSGSDTLKR